MFLMKGTRSASVTIHGWRKYTTSRKPANAASVLPLFSQFRMLLKPDEPVAIPVTQSREQRTCQE
jgi:hypothetical protein